MSSDPASKSFFKRIGKALSITHASGNKKEVSGQFTSPSSNSAPPAAASRAPEDRVAISITISGKNGLSDELTYQDGDDPEVVARAFVARNGLPVSAVPKLVGLIEQQWQENVVEKHLLPPRAASVNPNTHPKPSTTSSPKDNNGRGNGGASSSSFSQQQQQVSSPESEREVLSEGTSVDDSQQQQQPQQHTSLLSQSKHFRSGGGINSSDVSGRAMDASRADDAASASFLSNRGRRGGEQQQMPFSSPSRIVDLGSDASSMGSPQDGRADDEAQEEVDADEDVVIVSPRQADAEAAEEAQFYDNAKRQWGGDTASAAGGNGSSSSDALRAAFPSRKSFDGDSDIMPVSGRASVSSFVSNPRHNSNLRGGDGNSTVYSGYASMSATSGNTTCYDRLYREAEMRWARQERRRDAGINSTFESNFKTDFGKIPATQENLERVYNVGVKWQQRRDRHVDNRRRELQEREERAELQHCSFQPFMEKRLVNLSPERYRNDARNSGGGVRRARSMSPGASRGRAHSFNAATTTTSGTGTAGGGGDEGASVVSASSYAFAHRNSNSSTGGNRQRSNSAGGTTRNSFATSIYGRSQTEIENRQKQVHQRLFEEKKFREISHAKGLERSENMFDRQLFRPTIPRFSMALALKKKKEKVAARTEPRVIYAEDGTATYTNGTNINNSANGAVPSTPYANESLNQTSASIAYTGGGPGAQNANQLKRIIKSELKTISPPFGEKKDERRTPIATTAATSTSTEPTVDVFEELFNDASERRRRSSSAEGTRRKSMGIYEGDDRQLNPDRKVWTAEDIEAFNKRQQYFERRREMELENIDKKMKREQFGAQKHSVTDSYKAEQFAHRMNAYSERTKQKLERLRQEELKKISQGTKKKFIDPKSESMLQQMRSAALSEIFDVLLWSVKFNVRMGEAKRSGITAVIHEDDPLLLLSVADEHLDVAKSMPQLLRPQDVANLVEAFFASLPKDAKLTRFEFVEKMNHLPANILANLEQSDNKSVASSSKASSGRPRSKSTERRVSSGGNSTSSGYGTTSTSGTRRVLEPNVPRPTAMPLNMALFAPDVVKYNNNNSNNTTPSGPTTTNSSADGYDDDGASSRGRGRAQTPTDRSSGRGNTNTTSNSRGRSASAEGRQQGRRSLSWANDPNHIITSNGNENSSTNSNTNNPTSTSNRSKSPSYTNARSERLSLQGEQGERRKLGLSVFSGLHACDQVYRMKAAQSERAMWEDKLKDCTFQPKLYTRKPDRKRQQARRKQQQQQGEGEDQASV